MANSLLGNIATVVRNGSVGFSFTKMVDFNIYSLAFTSYNRSWSYGSHPSSNSALIFQPVQYAKLVNLFFLQQHWHCYCSKLYWHCSGREQYKLIHNQCVELSHRVRCTAFNNHWKLLEYFLCWVNLSISTSSLKFLNSFIGNLGNGTSIRSPRSQASPVLVLQFAFSI